MGRFINADGYVSTGQGILGFDMFIYCLNNPVNMLDDEGTDAIYVTDFSERGLPIVGHAKLYIQDEEGIWHETEYIGRGLDKSTAKIYVQAVEIDTVNPMIKGENIDNILYTYIAGDFSAGLDYAKENEGTDYDGYSLPMNNCLHYSRNVLKKGEFDNKVQELYVHGSSTIIPIQFHKDLLWGRALGSPFAVKRLEKATYKKALKKF